jgi:solute carrier family 38 (sodium-coupled neutral amino acid transporter), member 11
MLTTLPLEAFVCRSVMTTYYFPDEPFNPNRHLLFTSSLVVTSMILALITCDLGAVFELIGATSASALAYIFPPLCYVKLSNSSQKAKLPAYACIVFGTVVMVITLLQAVSKMIRSMSISLKHPSLKDVFMLIKYALVDEGGTHTCGGG